MQFNLCDGGFVQSAIVETISARKQTSMLINQMVYYNGKSK